MRRTRLAAAVAAAALTLTGCTGSDPDASSAASAPTPANPAMTLAASADALDAGDFGFTFKGNGMTGEGVVHAPSGSAAVGIEIASDRSTATVDLRFLEPEVYVRLDLGPAAAVGGLLAYNGRWLRGDRARLGGGEFDTLAEGKDVVGAAAVLATATSVEETAPGTYTGAVDLTRATGALFVDDDQNAALGAKATALPFTAVLDAEGRLRSLRIDVPAAGEYPAQVLEMTYFDYGAATPPARPAGDIVQAPDAVYEFFA